MSTIDCDLNPPGEGAILIAEDNQDDVNLLVRDLHKIGVSQSIHSVPDGNQVLAYVKGESPYDDRVKFPWPALLVLDLRMEPVNGLDVLRWLQSHPPTKPIPVLVVTASTNIHERTEAYRLGATTFLTKPTTLESLKDSFKGLHLL